MPEYKVFFHFVVGWYNTWKENQKCIQIDLLCEEERGCVSSRNHFWTIAKNTSESNRNLRLSAFIWDISELDLDSLRPSATLLRLSPRNGFGLRLRDLLLRDTTDSAVVSWPRKLDIICCNWLLIISYQLLTVVKNLRQLWLIDRCNFWNEFWRPSSKKLSFKQFYKKRTIK